MGRGSTILNTLITASGGRRIDYGSANTADHHFFGRQFGLSGFWGWAYVGFKFTAKIVASCLLFGAPGGPN